MDKMNMIEAYGKLACQCGCLTC